MNRRPHLTYPTVLVLHAIATGYQYGFDIMDVTGLASGTVYPALRRLERNGFLRSRWESERRAVDEQRPPRRYYEITRSGRGVLTDGLARFPGVERSLPVPAASRTAHL